MNIATLKPRQQARMDRRRRDRARAIARLRPIYLRAARAGTGVSILLSPRERTLVTREDLQSLQQWASFAAHPGLIYVSGRPSSGKSHILRAMLATREGGQ